MSAAGGVLAALATVISAAAMAATGDQEFAAKNYEAALNHYLEDDRRFTDSEVQLRIGQSYSELSRSPRDEAAADAFRWLELAAKTGNLQAAYEFGKEHSYACTYYAHPTVEDHAINWLIAAAEGGYPGADLLLGTRLLNSTYESRDARRLGQDWLTRSAAGGDHHAQHLLGLSLAMDIGPEYDPTAALRWLRAAKQGAPDRFDYSWRAIEFAALTATTKRGRELSRVELEVLAQNDESGTYAFRLAWYLDNGIIFRRDSRRANDWYRVAESRGSRLAALRLYRLGQAVDLGTSNDTGSAIKSLSPEEDLHRRAETDEDFAVRFEGPSFALAQLYAGDQLFRGTDRWRAELSLPTPDAQEAMFWFRTNIAMRRGSGRSPGLWETYRTLKLDYESGGRFLSSLERSVLHEAATRAIANLKESDNYHTKHAIAWFYAHGVGVKKSPTHAARLYLPGVDRNDWEALSQYAQLLESGELGRGRASDAEELYRRAAAQGSRVALKRLRNIRATEDLNDFERLAGSGSSAIGRIASSPQQRDPTVEELQRSLTQLGFDAGPIDGVFGTATAHGLEEFALAYGHPRPLPANDDTLRLLREKLHASSGNNAQAHKAAPKTQSEPVRKISLVIGNSRYLHTAALDNPEVDASAISGMLSLIGFESKLLLNQSFADLTSAIRNFGRESRTADIALFYFAGHGVQIDGENYILPVEANLDSEYDVAYEAVPVSLVLQELSRSEGIKLALLDACRDNPFAHRSWQQKGGTRAFRGGRGLAITRSKPFNTLLGFATEPGDVAEDGKGTHSPYANALLNWLPRRGIELSVAFRRIREEVMTATDGNQVPWENSSLVGDSIFLNPEP